MKFKVLGLALSLTAAFGLMACGDDSSSSASGDLPKSVEKITDATKLDCNADLKCKKVHVNEVDDDFVCDGKNFTPFNPVLDAEMCPEGEDGDDSGDSVEGDDDMPNVSKCEVKKDGDKVLVTIVADGITDQAPVFSKHISVLIHKCAVRSCPPGSSFDEIGIRSAPHEADVLGIRFMGIHKPIFLRHPAHFSFVRVFPQGKDRMRKLLLRHGIQDIRLILVRVLRPEQLPSSTLLLITDPRVVAGYDRVTSQLPAL